MMRCEPEIINAITSLHGETRKGGTADGSTSDFIKNKADNLGEILTKLPKTGVKVTNPTYRVSVIGRRVLNYCGGFGVE